jgi:hypothetical protein
MSAGLAPAIRAELADISRRETTLADRLSGRLIEPDTYSLAADALLREREGIERKLDATGDEKESSLDLRGAMTVWDLHNLLAPAMQDSIAFFGARRQTPEHEIRSRGIARASSSPMHCTVE